MKFQSDLSEYICDSAILCGRTNESAQIIKFIHSADYILHIVGQPGTGKTFTVNTVLSEAECSHVYTNYYTARNLASHVKSESEDAQIVVIDEFDKFFQEKKKQCLKLIVYLKSKNKKIITISNNLRMSQNNVLRFKPYTTLELKEILFSYIKTLDSDNLENPYLVFESPEVADFIAKKYSRSGDARELKSCLSCLLSLIRNRNHKIQMSDVLEMYIQEPGERDNDNNLNIHHKIILENIDESNMNNSSLYSKYLKECRMLSIGTLNRNEFNTICELYNK